MEEAYKSEWYTKYISGEAKSRAFYSSRINSSVNRFKL